MRAAAKKIYEILECRDFARMDFRLSADGKAYFIEINPLPGLNPEYSDLCIEARADGWSYESLVNRILDEAIERYGLSKD
jgi:D-alanine-D-alanine ligase